ncbi:MAG TPA: WhiB family transcriptional regulator [Acidimicrobiia bacterium]|nr:WhiB family transcriptional regulator [Acidimicrobiia bacterium]
MPISADLYFEAGEPWHAQAACASYPAEVFFPPSDAPQAAKAAKLICAGCPVRDECLSFAIDTAQSEGVWGGMDAGERRRLRRRIRDRERRRAS